MSDNRPLCRVAVVALGCLLAAAPAFAKPVHVDMVRRTPVNAAVRSALLPGWGQFFNEQKAKGWIAGGLFVVAAAGYVYYAGAADEDYKDYEARGLKADDLYADYESKKNSARTAALAAGALWFIAVIDAYASGRPRPDPNITARAPGLRLAMHPDAVSVRWERRF